MTKAVSWSTTISNRLRAAWSVTSAMRQTPSVRRPVRRMDHPVHAAVVDMALLAAEKSKPVRAGRGMSCTDCGKLRMTHINPTGHLGQQWWLWARRRQRPAEPVGGIQLAFGKQADAGTAKPLTSDVSKAGATVTNVYRMA